MYAVVSSVYCHWTSQRIRWMGVASPIYICWGAAGIQYICAYYAMLFGAVHCMIDGNYLHSNDVVLGGH